MVASASCLACRISKGTLCTLYRKLGHFSLDSSSCYCGPDSAPSSLVDIMTCSRDWYIDGNTIVVVGVVEKGSVDLL
jgi:hypothetical protein